MIKKLKRALGAVVGAGRTSGQGIIGGVDMSPKGNAIIETGGVNPDGSWSKNAEHGHIALTPDERDELIDVLSSQQEYKTIKLGDIIAVGRTVLAVQYVNGTGDLSEKVGTALTWDGREYAVLTLDAHGDAHYGTYTPDGQRALNAYITRVNEHLFRHFNQKPPTLTFAHVADRDKLTEGK